MREVEGRKNAEEKSMRWERKEGERIAEEKYKEKQESQAFYYNSRGASSPLSKD